MILEVNQPISLVVRQTRSPLPSRTFEATDRDVRRMVAFYQLRYGRRR